MKTAEEWLNELTEFGIDQILTIQQDARHSALSEAAEICSSMELSFAAGDSNILAEKAGFSNAILALRDKKES